ncbi:hypothetical protein ILUMI_08909 [Ignelater luminosus]|uniref:ER-bound oxygenase mpaB/mpaB'/Rubber oxygenase catalytic domain-containing protein n=1 Tax=Ignelater luminosus TaxID=2038154 RepID=A0A8K0GF09_IGNLU|nr:hypothetical protein ILUMI_08909 [Ignelater luminosus]
MDVNNTYKDQICVEEQINLFVNEYTPEPCDGSCTRFHDKETLPKFYDEEKFKIGQQFYHKHLFSMLLGKLLGLVTLLSTPSILKILIFTKMSSEPMTAYKRYMATVFHTCVWYENDFKPGSKLWRSIAAVKNMHNAASKKSCAIGSQPILQRDMGLTQFGFMGFVIVRSELIGIHNASQKELEGFVHLWRVIGYILGIDDRFNICRSSVEETKQLCEALLERIFVPNIKMQDPQYLQMADALINGMQVMEPSLDTKAYMTYLNKLLNYNLNNNESKIPDIELTSYQRFLVNVISLVTYYLKYNVVRWIYNIKQIISFWLLRHFPFIAFFKFSYKNSYVSIHIDRKST